MTTVQGTLNSTANTQFRVEIFSNTVCDQSGFGEGEKFVAFANVMTDAGGDGGFTQNIPTASLVGSFFTATATDPNGNTSEFAQCKTSAAASPGVLQFGTNILSFSEGVGTASVTVTRTQGSAGTVQVDYTTGPTNQSNKATAGADYVTTSGQLTFLDGETSKTIAVPIIDDLVSEQEEAFIMTLSNPTGGATIGNQIKSILNTSEQRNLLDFLTQLSGETESAGSARDYQLLRLARNLKNIFGRN